MFEKPTSGAPHPTARPAGGRIVGWPAHLRPPGVAEWEADSVALLLDCCPPDFRGYQVLRRHPVVLALFADHLIAAQAAATEAGTAAVRTELSGLVGEDVIEEAIQAWLTEAARLARTRRVVGLVAEALRGPR